MAWAALPVTLTIPSCVDYDHTQSTQERASVSFLGNYVSFLHIPSKKSQIMLVGIKTSYTVPTKRSRLIQNPKFCVKSKERKRLPFESSTERDFRLSLHTCTVCHCPIKFLYISLWLTCLSYPQYRIFYRPCVFLILHDIWHSPSDIRKPILFS